MTIVRSLNLIAFHIRWSSSRTTYPDEIPVPPPPPIIFGLILGSCSGMCPAGKEWDITLNDLQKLQPRSQSLITASLAKWVVESSDGEVLAARGKRLQKLSTQFTGLANRTSILNKKILQSDGEHRECQIYSVYHGKFKLENVTTESCKQGYSSKLFTQENAPRNLSISYVYDFINAILTRLTNHCETKFKIPHERQIFISRIYNKYSKNQLLRTKNLKIVKISTI